MKRTGLKLNYKHEQSRADLANAILVPSSFQANLIEDRTQDNKVVLKQTATARVDVYASQTAYQEKATPVFSNIVFNDLLIDVEKASTDVDTLILNAIKEKYYSKATTSLTPLTKS